MERMAAAAIPRPFSPFPLFSFFFFLFFLYLGNGTRPRQRMQAASDKDGWKNKERRHFTALNYTAAPCDRGERVLSLWRGRCVFLGFFFFNSGTCPPSPAPAAALMNVHSVALPDTEITGSFRLPLSEKPKRPLEVFLGFFVFLFFFLADLSPEGSICPAPARSPQWGPDRRRS